MRESNPIPAPGLLEYPADFYTITDEDVDGAAWTVGARLGDEAGMHRSSWGVVFDADEREKVLRVRAESVLALAMTTRKAPREGLVEYCEKRRYVMLHASAFAEDHRVVLVVGRKSSGKTTSIPLKIGTYWTSKARSPRRGRSPTCLNGGGYLLPEVVCGGGAPAAGEFQLFSSEMRSSDTKPGKVAGQV